MSPKRFVVIAISVVSLLLAAIGAHAAQTQLQLPTPQPPTIVSGADFGFRITATKGGHAVGTLVVKQNGQWVEADLGGMTVKQLSLR